MIPLEVAGMFFVASVALGIAPGPDNIFVLTQSALHGRRAGLLVTLGLCTGLVCHTTAVALGVAALFQASSIAFTMLKLAGAAYLLYLAWKAIRAGASAIDGIAPPPMSGAALYRRGVILNITNPKVAIFFLAFLPQFADPERGSLPAQMFGFGALFILATLIVFGGVALGAGLVGEWLKRSRRAQIAMNRVAAAIFVALALRLVVS